MDLISGAQNFMYLIKEKIKINSFIVKDSR